MKKVFKILLVEIGLPVWFVLLLIIDTSLGVYFNLTDETISLLEGQSNSFLCLKGNLHTYSTFNGENGFEMIITPKVGEDLKTIKCEE